MSKMNNRGFLLAESLIVSTFVLTVLIFLFVQFRNLMANHKRSYTYNSVENIYDLGSLSDYLKNSGQLNKLKIDLGENLYIEVYKNSSCINIINPDICTDLATAMGLDYMIYTNSDIDIIKSNLNAAALPEDMKNFIKKVDATKVEDKGRLIAKFKNGNFATIAADTPIVIQSPEIGNESSPFSGTVYAWNTTDIIVGTSTINDLVSSKTAQPYYTSASDVMSASGYTFFNKYTVVNDTITEGYTCQTFGISGLEPVCLKMSTDGSEYGYDAGGNHTGNAGILKALQSNSKFTGSCNFQSSGLSCTFDDQELYAYSNGQVLAYDDGPGKRCDVGNNGYASCSR